MTPTELADAIKLAGMGWSIRGAITTLAAADGDRCNPVACRGYAAMANDLGLTSDQVMPALVLLAGDPLAEPPVPRDKSAIRSIISDQDAWHFALTSRGLGWLSTDGDMRVWLKAARVVTETGPTWEGVAVTTQAYREQAGFAGADDDDMAQALLELVGTPVVEADPEADPPIVAVPAVPPDASAFDAIMSA